MDQPTILWITIAVVAILVVAIGAFALSQRRRQHLREHFGPEYQRCSPSKEIADVRSASSANARRG
jgi:hypothetical protein